MYRARLQTALLNAEIIIKIIVIIIIIIIIMETFY